MTPIAFVQEVRAIVTQLGQTNLWTFAVGLLTLGIILGLRRWAPRAPGILFAVLAAIIFTSLFNLPAHGVAIVGLATGLPSATVATRLPFGSPDSYRHGVWHLTGGHWRHDLHFGGIRFAPGAGGRRQSGACRHRRGECAGGFFQGFPISTSGSRTAVAEQSGAKTQLTGVVSAAVVLVMLLFFPGLVRNLPQSALAAILIVAASGLLDLEGLRQLLRESQSEFVLAIICALGVIFIGVLQGILLAILLSVFQLFARIWRPRWAVMGQEDGLPGFQDLRRHPAARPLPEILIIRWSAPLMFANATVFRSVVREQLAQRDPQPKWVVIAAEPITELDTTAGDMLRDLDLELNAKGIHLAFAELQGPVREHLIKLGLQETIDARNFYPTLDTAIEAIVEQAPTE